MATTDVTLYRSLVGDDSRLRVRDGVPDPGMLDPQWDAKSWTDREGNKKSRNPDVRILMGPDGPEGNPMARALRCTMSAAGFPPVSSSSRRAPPVRTKFLSSRTRTPGPIRKEPSPASITC